MIDLQKTNQPELVTYLEFNQKHGRGYQARLIMAGIIDSVIDDEPFTLDEAYSGATFAIEQISKEIGYNYDPQKLIHIRGEAIQGNKRHDLTTARVARDIERGHGELSTPITTDYAKEEIYLTGRGAVLTVYFSWIDDKMPKAREALRRYCEYLAMRGYGGGTSSILAEVDGMDKDRGTDWIKATFGKYVANDATVINYIMQSK